MRIWAYFRQHDPVEKILENFLGVVNNIGTNFLRVLSVPIFGKRLYRCQFFRERHLLQILSSGNVIEKRNAINLGYYGPHPQWPGKTHWSWFMYGRDI